MNYRQNKWQQFHLLSKGEQRKAYEEFEAKMQKWLDKNFYPSLGKVTRSATDKRDLIVEIGKRQVSAEEKIRTKVWDDFLIEILQDVTPPLVEKKWGWLYYCNSDRLVYVMCDSPLAEEAEKIYVVKVKRFKEIFPELIKGGAYTLPGINKTGQGLSLNIAIPWSVLELNEVATKMYQKTHQP